MFSYWHDFGLGVKVLQEGRQSAKLSIFFIAIKLLNPIKVVRVQEPSDVIILSNKLLTSTIMVSDRSLPSIFRFFR